MESAVSNNYLSQNEASKLAGVSSATLMRFAEAGYFKVIQKDGESQFSRIEIMEVFGTAIAPENSIKKQTSVKKSTVKNKEDNLFNTSPLAQQIEKFVDDQAIPTSNSTNNDLNDIGNVEVKEEPLRAIASDDLLSDDSALEKSIEAAPQSELDQTSSNKSDNSYEAFKKVLQLQEELLSQKDLRISELIKERDWLRSRLEKMEDKSDRDQMLLMVESQKVRTLIEKTPGKNSNIFRAALDWLGGNKNQEESKDNNRNKD